MKFEWNTRVKLSEIELVNFRAWNWHIFGDFRVFLKLEKCQNDMFSEQLIMKPTKIAKISPASNKQWASQKLEFHSSENQKVSSEQKFQNFLESWVKFEWKTRVKLSDALTRQIPESECGLVFVLKKRKGRRW